MRVRIRHNPVALRAVAELEAGGNAAEIAARSGVDERTVRRWREALSKPPSQPLPRRNAPSCNRCSLRELCSRSVRAGGAFARDECNEIDRDLAFSFVVDVAAEQQRIRRLKQTAHRKSQVMVY